MAPVIAATIAAFASITAALLTCIVAYRSARRAAREQQQLEQLKIQAQGELERLKSNLAQGTAETSARRAYEFDALKRLYEEVEPLLFQLGEAASVASNRIRNLSRASRNGDLASWMASDDGYYFRSTIHSLLVPLGLVHILRQRLTFLDLSLDARIARQYELGRALNRSFSRDHEFAAAKTEIPYHPNAQPPSKPDVRQGVFAGNLQRAVGRMILTDGARERVKTFGELSTELDDSQSPSRTDLKPVMDIFRDFTPATRPVLWRILIAQLLVYRALRDCTAADVDKLVAGALLKEEDRHEFSPGGDPALMDDALTEGEAFLRRSLSGRT